jgi:hypothetical protein
MHAAGTYALPRERRHLLWIAMRTRRTLLDYFHSVEEAAGVEHVAERAWYGLRRLWADLGPEHVQTARAREILGGWARGSTVPQKVYKTKQDELAIRKPHGPDRRSARSCGLDGWAPA